jgi:predicted nuclease of restriction endonuclease-like (RecB) superfamily
VTARVRADTDYARFVSEIKGRITTARLSAARAVNHELVSLYWNIGQAIRQKQAVHGWGDGVVERLAGDLKAAFPGTKGFSAVNLWRMRQLHEAYTAPELLSQLVRESARPLQSGSCAPCVSDEDLAQAVRDLVQAVPWGHHVNMLGKIGDAAQRLYYLRATARFGWSRNVLLNQIKARARCKNGSWKTG